jgi:hypothetical protein
MMGALNILWSKVNSIKVLKRYQLLYLFHYYAINDDQDISRPRLRSFNWLVESVLGRG